VLVIQNHPHPSPFPEYVSTALSTGREKGPEAYRAIPSTCRPGSGSIEFTRVGTNTAVTTARAQSPLKLLCPRSAGRSAWVFTSNYGGGLLAGDDVRLGIHGGEGTTSLLSTQASTKIYRSRSGAGARQSISARIEAGALCVVAPDPVVCFAGARFEQRQQFHLDESASLVLIDSLTSGRLARGERWAFSRYRSSNQIILGDRRIFRDTLLLDPADGPLVHPQRMGRIDCLAMALLIGPRVQPAAESLLASISAQPPGLDPATRLLVSASPIRVDGMSSGVVVRIAGGGTEPVGRYLKQILAFLCPLLGEDPWKRKW
jgi:urease accessory protein